MRCRLCRQRRRRRATMTPSRRFTSRPPAIYIYPRYVQYSLLCTYTHTDMWKLEKFKLNQQCIHRTNATHICVLVSYIAYHIYTVNTHLHISKQQFESREMKVGERFSCVRLTFLKRAQNFFGAPNNCANNAQKICCTARARILKHFNSNWFAFRFLFGLIRKFLKYIL